MASIGKTIIASRPAATVLALSLVAGLSTPFVILQRAGAAAVVPNGTTELSAAPVDQVKTVPPNVMVTFDDSGSMAFDYLGDDSPFNNASWGNRDPWYCAGVISPGATTGIGTHVMNGVYYNPNVEYVPPINADGSSFPNADATLTGVWKDGVTANRPLSPSGASNKTNFTGTNDGPDDDNRWRCPADDWNGRSEDGVNPITGGGPYYYQLKASALTTLEGQLDAFGSPTTAGLSTLYDRDNWEAVALPNTDVVINGHTVNQWQNWANWWAYYHTRNQMARTALSRVFGSGNLAARNQNGGFGTDIRVSWQNINTTNFKLPSDAIISALIDTADCTAAQSAAADPKNTQRQGAVTTPPDCYRSAFFNWIFQVPARNATPLRSALDRAGKFFQRGDGNTGATGNLLDPYWQPPQTGTFDAGTNPGNELYCRQNFSLLLTDGLWNGNYDGPKYATLTLADAGTALPDGVVPPVPGGGNVTSIFAPKHNGYRGQTDYASLSDVAYNYWATNLRSDLYDPTNGKYVPAYIPDTTTGLFTGAGDVVGGYGAAENIPAEQYFNPRNDPATWPHMSAYMVGMGVSGILNFSDNTDCTDTATPIKQDACALRKGEVNSTGSVGWTQPSNYGNTGVSENIDDTWHAALAGRGEYFSAGNPQQLVDQLGSILSSIAARAAAPQASGVNASVATAGALSFNAGYNADWSGILQAVTLNADGTAGPVVWDVGATLDATSASDRNIITGAYSGGSFSTFAFDGGNAGLLDPVELAGMEAPPLAGGNDTLANRIDYLAGDRTHESDATYRTRAHLLGAIIHSQPVYVSYPSGGYYNTWPANSPEADNSAQTYDDFVSKHTTRAGTVYIGANDGMLHAFNAPVPKCTNYDNTGVCTTWDYGSNPGQEDWAYVPRAVYANLGNLTSASDFEFRPTVDATPVTRDVFFTSNSTWHTILAGGVGVGGRGVYAIDITGADNSDAAPSAPNKILWEFDSDMAVDGGCVARSGSSSDTDGGGCKATDLGYTVPQPNIGRLHNKKWMVIVPNGYFPDCSKTDTPTGDSGDVSRCADIAAQAPKYSDGSPYSALFVLDAETGKMVAELKTPNLSSDGIYSFGLGTPVLGDYNNDQVDDVAFAGDLQGNLWRFDLTADSPTGWTVSLVYEGLKDADGNQGLQPITTMPRLFPDASTANQFIIVFGTGKYLGADDNGTTQVQAVYGIREAAAPVEQPDTQLVQQFLHEYTPSSGDYAGLTLRCITGSAGDTCETGSPPNAVPNTASGWYFNLYTTAADGTQTNEGERVVVTPGAIFASNTVIIPTLMTGTEGSDPCNPATQGAVMFVNANDGGPGYGLSSLGGEPYVGARVNNARTSGTLPVVSALGGGQLFIPGVTLSGSTKPIVGDLPIWRRRSWNVINENQNQ